MIFLLLLIALEVGADVYAKKYGMTHQLRWFAASLIAYVLANTSWLMYMRGENKLALGANIFSVSTGIIAAVIGCKFYGEVLSPTQIVGVVLGVAALALLLI